MNFKMLLLRFTIVTLSIQVRVSLYPAVACPFPSDDTIDESQIPPTILDSGERCNCQSLASSWPLLGCM